ncbi:MAG: hypothetical protein QNJ12_12350 [Ilumatobacter sp.]|uniref:hypothetical protein n=1 Tax=Ilumatobacter sp. TaxID=1967498 RepID=UPI0026114B3B|nr:hypothetical protein [Ilumatobacter sp.]MDJ0769583.1 hypothetical protein [Ilumatobacter sp.]
MASLAPLPDLFVPTRDALQRVAVHVVARARQQGTGRFGLRVTPGGFGTPEFGDDVVRVRVSGGLLVREVAGTDGSNSAATAIDGASLADLAQVARVDLGVELDVGHDTPPIGPIDEALAVDEASARALARWFAVAAQALDRVVATSPAAAEPSAIQLWPEHFDAALDLAATAERRVNLGGSPGDGFHAEPYLYVGPWTDDRPGDTGFWNAPFGAVLGYDAVLAADDPVAVAVDFYRRGVELLAS